MINPTNRTGSTGSSSNVGGVSRQSSRPAAPARPAPPGDNFSTEALSRLQASLEAQPAVRPDVVALGQSLAADPDYPPPPVVRKLAELLVAHPGDQDSDVDAE